MTQIADKVYRNAKVYSIALDGRLKEFCMFNIADSNEFLVCQIPNAHFVMYKELQKYNFGLGRYSDLHRSSLMGNGRKAPNPALGRDAIYRPEWHEAGSVKIENPKELQSKLISTDEALTIHSYYESYTKQEKVWWHKFMVEGTKIKDKENNDIEMAGGAVYSQKPSGVKDNTLFLMLSQKNNSKNGFFDWPMIGWPNSFGSEWHIEILPFMTEYKQAIRTEIGYLRNDRFLSNSYRSYWEKYLENKEFYAAIVAKRY